MSDGKKRSYHGNTYSHKTGAFSCRFAEVCMTFVTTRHKKVNRFQVNVPLMEKPDGWFLVTKCVKNACGRVTF